MALRDRGPGAPTRRRNWSYTPEGEMLEGRRLLTGTVDLANIQANSLGTEMVGTGPTAATSASAANPNIPTINAGYTVTDVGNVTGSGYDSFVITASNVSTPSSSPATFNSNGSAVYLVFGSKQVNAANAVDYLTLTPAQRAGDLNYLGTLGPAGLGQVNPTVRQPTNGTTTYGFNYDGLTFVTGLSTSTGEGTNSGLGFSVAALGDLNGDGYADFAIGAPNDSGGGRVFIIYGGPALASQANANKTIDLEPTVGTISTTTPTKVVSLSLPTTDASPTNEVGYSVGALGNYFNYSASIRDVAIGVPGFDVSGVGANTGAVFAISGAFINSQATGANIDLSTVGTTGTEGIEYNGADAGDRVGSSVGTAGDFDGTFSGTTAIDDLAIGAPGANSGAGRVYVVYSQQVYQPNQVRGQTLSLSTVGMTPTITPLFNPLSGVVFNAANANSHFGFTIDWGGNFNGGSADDLLVGAPGTGLTTGTGASATGYAALFYGVPSSNSTGRLNGIFTVGPNSTNASFSALYLTGENPGDLAGYSVSNVGDIPGVGATGILIGAPNYNSGSGAAYVIPGNYNLTGTMSLTTAYTSAAIAGTQLVISSSYPGSTPYLGTSVSGRPVGPLYGLTSSHTVDSDTTPDVIVGAPGFSLTQPNTGTELRTNSGAGFYLSGASLGIGIPNNVLTTSAGVNSNNPTATSYTISPTAADTFYIFSMAANGTLPAFDPTVDLTSPITLTIDGVQFTNIALTDGKDSTGANDVSFVLTAGQIASLNLTAGATITITIRGTTNATLGNVVFVATAKNVLVNSSGGGGGGGGGGGSSISNGAPVTYLTNPIFTGDDFGLPYPPVSELEHLTSYQPLPVQIAYQQFLPAPGFLAREQVYHHPSQAKGVHQAPVGTSLYIHGIGRTSESRYDRILTQSKTALSQDKFKVSGTTIKFTHKQKVIPRSEQTETFTYN